MKINEYKIKSNFDGLELQTIEYRPENFNKVILIVHGMCEHQLRYNSFATYLAKYGYLVYTYDHRGHGRSIKDESELGYFSKKDGAKAMINDLSTIVNFIKLQNPNCEFYIFAHSMGSIITRCFLQEHSQLVDKVILSGAPNYQALAPLGLFIANLVILFKGDKKRSKLLTSLSLGKFNKKVDNPKTQNDWISYNEANVKKYNDDKLCSFTFTNNGYKNLFKLLIKMHKVRNFKNVNHNLKILFMAGEDDPCTGGNKGLNSSARTLVKAGFKDISRQVFQGMRHEILNEVDHLNVYEEAVNFYE